MRNETILKLTELLQNEQILIVTRYVAHCNKLKEMIPGSELIYGQTEDEIRKDLRLGVQRNQRW